MDVGRAWFSVYLRYLSITVHNIIKTLRNGIPTEHRSSKEDRMGIIARMDLPWARSATKCSASIDFPNSHPGSCTAMTCVALLRASRLNSRSHEPDGNSHDARPDPINTRHPRIDQLVIHT